MYKISSYMQTKLENIKFEILGKEKTKWELSLKYLKTGRSRKKKKKVWERYFKQKMTVYI